MEICINNESGNGLVPDDLALGNFTETALVSMYKCVKFEKNLGKLWPVECSQTSHMMGDDLWSKGHQIHGHWVIYNSDSQDCHSIFNHRQLNSLFSSMIRQYDPIIKGLKWPLISFHDWLLYFTITYSPGCVAWCSSHWRSFEQICNQILIYILSHISPITMKFCKYQASRTVLMCDPDQSSLNYSNNNVHRIGKWSTYC